MNQVVEPEWEADYYEVTATGSTEGKPTYQYTGTFHVDLDFIRHTDVYLFFGFIRESFVQNVLDLIGASIDPDSVEFCWLDKRSGHTTQHPILTSGDRA